mgnify:CR=1 FL=1
MSRTRNQVAFPNTHTHIRHRNMDAASGTSLGIFNILGKGLKLNSKEDISPYLTELEKIEPLHEIHLGGNTLGVGACQALADVLKTKKTLKVADMADIFTGRPVSYTHLTLPTTPYV